MKSGIKPFKKVAVDSNCFIYHFEDVAPFSEKTTGFFKWVEKWNTEVICSSLVVAELLAKKEVASDYEARERLKFKLLSLPNIKLIDPDPYICEKAAILKARHNFKLPDALHLATAILTECDAFVTVDRQFKRVVEIDIIDLC